MSERPEIPNELPLGGLRHPAAALSLADIDAIEHSRDGILAFVEGIRSAARGVGLGANPHAHDSIQAKAWSGGWYVHHNQFPGDAIAPDAGGPS